MKTPTVFINDIDLAISVMRDAASWLKNSGKNPSEYWREEIMNRDYFLKHADPSDFIVGLIDRKPAIACLLQDNQRNQSWHKVDGNVQKPALYIHWLCVHRLYRGMNLPVAIIVFAIDVAKKRNLPYIRLDTEVGKIKLHHIYEKLGFKNMGIFDNTVFYQKEV